MDQILFLKALLGKEQKDTSNRLHAYIEKFIDDIHEQNSLEIRRKRKKVVNKNLTFGTGLRSADDRILAIQRKRKQMENI